MFSLELVTTTHIISYGSSFVMECSFINDQFTGISRVEWIDLKNGVRKPKSGRRYREILRSGELERVRKIEIERERERQDVYRVRER